jgi:hypothetical protein
MGLLTNQYKGLDTCRGHDTSKAVDFLGAVWGPNGCLRKYLGPGEPGGVFFKTYEIQCFGWMNILRFQSTWLRPTFSEVVAPSI